MHARLRVRRRSLNAPQAGAAACQAAFGATLAPQASARRPPSSRLRLRGVRATRGNYLCLNLCSAPSSCDGVEGVFCVSEGARQSGACVA